MPLLVVVLSAMNRRHGERFFRARVGASVKRQPRAARPYRCPRAAKQLLQNGLAFGDSASARTKTELHRGFAHR